MIRSDAKARFAANHFAGAEATEDVARDCVECAERVCRISIDGIEHLHGEKANRVAARGRTALGRFSNPVLRRYSGRGGLLTVHLADCEDLQ